MFDKIKSLFIIEEENTKTSKKTTAKNPKTSPQKPPPTQGNNTPPSQTIPAGKVNQKFSNVLFGAMDKNNLDGFDYLEFKQSLQSLSKMTMDEATRYQSAFAMAQTMGATPEKLIETAGHYLQVLKQEENKFGQALAHQRSKQIGGKEEGIQQLDATIKQKQQQIAQLQKEIEQHQKQMQAAEKQIQQARLKVETTKRDFEATYNRIVSQIQGDIANMKKYFSGSSK